MLGKKNQNKKSIIIDYVLHVCRKKKCLDYAATKKKKTNPMGTHNNKLQLR